MPVRLAALAVLLLVTSCHKAWGACARPRASAGYTARVEQALRSGRDLWGDELLRARGGPTLAGARRFLAPLRYAKTSKGRDLTDSGVYYVAFGVPGSGTTFLHVADGSEILARRVGGAKLRLPLPSCGTPRLASGWLPILQTRNEESFAWRTPQGLAAFVHAGSTYLTWRSGAPQRIGAAAYDDARAQLVAYWQQHVTAPFLVPERAVMNAERNLLVQAQTMSWRYSLGNAYEEFSFPESLDVAQVLAEYGLADLSAQAIRASLARRPTPYPGWKMGEKLLAAATHWRLNEDRAVLTELTPTLRGYVAALSRSTTTRGLVARERYSSDIPDAVYGLHAQAVVWQGLEGVADAWSATGRGTDAARARTLAARTGRAVRAQVAHDTRRLPDGTLFVPTRLVDGEGPYRSLTESRDASYWNLVMPYALASGLVPRRPILDYMLAHGSRLLGMVRAGAFALYGQDARPPTGGTDQVYGLNVSRALADEDDPDQLALSLYGQLAAGMTPNTFVAGEGATVAPLHGELYRSMYLPPNSASNAAFLETLRLTLVHESARGLDLAFATPRAWLAPGKRVEVRAAPTRFGPVSYVLDAHADDVHATIEVPSRHRPRALRLRVRLPPGQRIREVTLDGSPYTRFNAQTETIDLSGHVGSLDLVVRHAAR